MTPLEPLSKYAEVSGNIAFKHSILHLNIYRFDVQERRYANAGQPVYRHALEPESSAIGEFTLFNDTTGLVIEWDSGQGGSARFKKNEIPTSTRKRE